MRATSLVLAMASGPVAMSWAQEPNPLGYASVAATLAALRATPGAEFREQSGWTVVASREDDSPVQWFFTASGHPAHPAVVKRTALERGGVGLIDLVALCEARQADCDRLLDDFRQQHELEVAAARPERVSLDIGIALNDAERVRVNRLVAEEGLAAEIRLPDKMKMVVVPTVDAAGGVLLWTAVYEFDGRGYTLLGEPHFASPGVGTTTLEVASPSGTRYGLSMASAAVRAE